MQSSDRMGVHFGFSVASSAFFDALRAIAANLVLISHIVRIYLPNSFSYFGGALGVTIFFLISGFLITQSMLNRIGHGDRPLFPVFLADRVARIMTPYVPILFAIFLLDYLLIGNKVGGEGLSRGVVPLIGNLFMLQDYPAFQMLDLLHINVWWRIRPYNTAEPFWTVAVEFWTYIAVGLFFFCVVVGEKINKAWKVILILLSAPVFIWNAAAGGGHALSLIWAAGAIAGYLIHGIKVINPKAIRIRSAWIVVFGAVALGGENWQVWNRPV